MNKLDFSLAPLLDKGSAWYSLPENLAKQLSKFPSTLDRAKGAIHLAVKISNHPKELDGSDVKCRETYLRAALGEFSSMEEALSFDDPKIPKIKITSSKNPLLHIMKQLRNMQFHLIRSSLNFEIKNVNWGGDEIPITFWYIEDIKLSDFERLDASRYYSPPDRKKLVGWFNDNQRIWGVGELILQAVVSFSQEILNYSEMKL